MATVSKVNLTQKFALFNERWKPKIVGELNDSYIKVVKLKGEFVWHHHVKEDELFLVAKGSLTIKVRGQKDLHLHEGDFAIIPKGMEHKPVADEEVQLVLMEPKTTVNTGNVKNERTTEAEWI